MSVKSHLIGVVIAAVMLAEGLVVQARPIVVRTPPPRARSTRVVGRRAPSGVGLDPRLLPVEPRTVRLDGRKVGSPTTSRRKMGVAEVAPQPPGLHIRSGPLALVRQPSGGGNSMRKRLLTAILSTGLLLATTPPSHHAATKPSSHQARPKKGKTKIASASRSRRRGTAARRVGIGSAGGAAVGAIAGGGRGAAMGGILGAGAGAVHHNRQRSRNNRNRSK